MNTDSPFKVERPFRPRLTNGSTRYGVFGPKNLRHPFEIPMLVIAVAASVSLYLYWLSVIISFFVPETREAAMAAFEESSMFVQMLLVIPMLPLILWIMRALMYAQMRANGVRMSPNQFPEGYRMVVEAAQEFGLRRVPDAYVVSGNGVINAFAFGHGFRRTVVVHSDLFEVGGPARDPEALRFVIAHEVGHHALGHTSFFRLLFTNLAMSIPLLGHALSRAQEYSADNVGYAHCPSGSLGTVALLAGGKYLNAEVNMHEMADRATLEKGLWIHLVHWTSTHPVLTWRASALRDRSRPGRMFLRPGLLGGSRNLFLGPLPAGSIFSKYYPTPDEVAAMLDQADELREKGSDRQFGRFPGVDYSHRPTMREMQLGTPTLAERSPVEQPVAIGQISALSPRDTHTAPSSAHSPYEAAPTPRGEALAQHGGALAPRGEARASHGGDQAMTAGSPANGGNAQFYGPGSTTNNSNAQYDSAQYHSASSPGYSPGSYAAQPEAPAGAHGRRAQVSDGSSPARGHGEPPNTAGSSRNGRGTYSAQSSANLAPEEDVWNLDGYDQSNGSEPPRWS